MALPLAFLMNPAFWNSPIGGAMTSFGLPALAKLFGHGRAENDQYRQMLEYQAKLREIMSPQHLDKQFVSNLDKLNAASSFDRQQALVDSMAAGNKLQAGFARAGQSGIGVAAGILGGQLAGNDIRRLNALNRKDAMDLARGDQQREFNMQATLMPLQRPTPGLDILGAGVDNFQNYLNDYFAKAPQAKATPAAAPETGGMRMSPAASMMLYGGAPLGSLALPRQQFGVPRFGPARRGFRF